MNPLYIIEIVVGIGILVAIHELGHFLAAKWAGVRVDKFAIGMGPRIFWFTRGETEYSLRLLPVGGFVAMAGEEPGSTTEAPPERQYRYQPAARKALILFAGSFMNFLLAIVFFAVAFGVGVNFTRPLVAYVEPDGPADRAGIRPGDEVVAVNGDREVDWEDIHAEVMMTSPGDNLTLTILRDGREHDVSVRPVLSKDLGLPVIGVEVATGRTVARLDKGGAAEAAGLAKDDVIETIDGTRFLHWQDILIYLSGRVGKDVSLVVTRDGKELPVTLVPRASKRGWIGVMPAHFPSVRIVSDNGPAARAGLRVGDEILAVEGVPTPTVDDLVLRTDIGRGRPLLYTVRRDGETMDLPITPQVMPGEKRARIGIAPRPADNLTLGAVDDNSPAAAAGLRPGDLLTQAGKASLDGKSWDLFQALLDEALQKDGRIPLQWQSGRAEFPPVEVAVKAVAYPLRASVGFAVEGGERRMRRYSPWRAPVVGLKKSWQVVRSVYVSIKGMLTRSISPKNAAGPVGIIRFSYAVAAEGPSKFIFWLAFLSANFAVVNLLPMTPFDGGLIVITGVEKLRGKPISEKWIMRLLMAGWALVIVLLVFITINDIMR